MKRSIAISLLLIFVAGQFNLTWADHFCMDFKVNSKVMVGPGYLDCGMGEMMECDDEESTINGPVFKVPSCCTNEYYSSDSDDHFNLSETVSGKQLLFVAILSETLLSFVPEKDEYKVLITSSPPLIQHDRQIMYQTFLL